MFIWLNHCLIFITTISWNFHSVLLKFIKKILILLCKISLVKYFFRNFHRHSHLYVYWMREQVAIKNDILLSFATHKHTVVGTGLRHTGLFKPKQWTPEGLMLSQTNATTSSHLCYHFKFIAVQLRADLSIIQRKKSRQLCPSTSIFSSNWIIYWMLIYCFTSPDQEE